MLNIESSEPWLLIERLLIEKKMYYAKINNREEFELGLQKVGTVGTVGDGKKTQKERKIPVFFLPDFCRE